MSANIIEFPNQHRNALPDASAVPLFRKIDDSAHGWLEVPKQLIAQLRIATRISRFSYVNRNYVYLEEDCDMTLFMDAMRRMNYDFRISETYCDGDCFVRRLPNFEA